MREYGCDIRFMLSSSNFGQEAIHLQILFYYANKTIDTI